MNRWQIILLICIKNVWCRPDFVSTLSALLPQLEQDYGSDFICALHQLRSPLQVTQLPTEAWMAKLQAHGGVVWKSREV